MTRVGRVDVANEFIQIISAHGRRFFHHNGRVSRFELDERGRVWFVDKWSGFRIWTHQGERFWGWKFSEGGTLQQLCIELRRYIMGERRLPLEYLGPWSKALQDGDLWGYGEDMDVVRQLCAELIRIPSHPAKGVDDLP